MSADPLLQSLQWGRSFGMFLV